MRPVDDIKCPKCGNVDQDKFLVETEPYMLRVKELRGQTLKGVRCTECKEFIALS